MLKSKVAFKKNGENTLIKTTCIRTLQSYLYRFFLIPIIIIMIFTFTTTNYISTTFMLYLVKDYCFV